MSVGNVTLEEADLLFDVVSPYAYLYWMRRHELHPSIRLRPVPVLFAGLLKAHAHKGPAEIESKRVHTYQHCVHEARRRGIPFRMPARHPFNPLGALRLLVALDVAEPVVDAAFEFVFGRGMDPETEPDALCRTLGVDDFERRVEQTNAKARLIENTRDAVARGVFGVPTLVYRGQVFWGCDTIDWVNDYVADPALFDSAEMRRAASTETGVRRKQVS